MVTFVEFVDHSATSLQYNKIKDVVTISTASNGAARSKKWAH